MWAALESGLSSALEAADTPSTPNPKTSAEYVKRTYKASAPTAWHRYSIEKARSPGLSHLHQLKKAALQLRLFDLDLVALAHFLDVRLRRVVAIDLAQLFAQHGLLLGRHLL